ncbi:unnamed protein product [Protopolystoma xenopodis]|uniref:Sphingolipid delta4-desaturase N-terminal domain-containing protein n=1 Tax=Protopolystoma xenopodis TaxID=117903 RepID=A0A3S5AC67_9PLAT|nr:unnamed protein product [Protopolystoma xenopodis]
MITYNKRTKSSMQTTYAMTNKTYSYASQHIIKWLRLIGVKEILARHPEIKQLMGCDPTIAYIVLLEVTLQMAICWSIRTYQPTFLVWLAATYFISGTLNHSLGSSIHEIGHNLAFGHRYPVSNRVLSLVANLPLIVPMAISYKKYHHEHHR